MHTSQLPPRPQVIPSLPTQQRQTEQPFHYDGQRGQNGQRFIDAWEADRSWTERMHADMAIRMQQQQQQARQMEQAQQHHSHHHRVYLLNCSLCDTFLSDRGMRAVLLLKPSITLFSTDAAPLNSGPQYEDSDVVPEVVERTCDCLTESLSCFGCGGTIGYQIIAPCAICTQSVSQNSKSANGHRYVFHYRAVVARERKYREGEAGVVNFRSSHLRMALPGEPILRPAANSDFSTTPRRQRSNTLCGENDPAAPSSVLSSTNSTPEARPWNRSLQTGDTVYWHHLKMGGERVVPVDPDAIKFKMPVCGR